MTKRSSVSTELVTYRCPSCKTFNKPYFHNRKGIAFTLCSECKAQYKTSTKASASFRKFSSRHGRKPNRSPIHYSSSERSGKKFLEKLGLVEGFDFFHNPRVETVSVNGRKMYYWLDFVVPAVKLVIEISPEMWHRLDGVPEKDERKRKFIEDLGWTLIDLKTADVRRLNRTRPNSSKRTKVCRELDKILKLKEQGKRGETKCC